MARLNVDEIVQTYDLDDSKFKGKIQGIKSQIADAMSFGPSSGMAAFGANAAVAGIGGITAALAAMGAVGKSAFEQFATFDSQVKALESVEGSAKAATRAMADLREISKAPGIGFAESVSSYVQLRNAGIGGSKAEALIREIANANARGGGGIDTFSRAMMAISQIAMKPQLQGEELMQLMEAGIPVQGMIRNRFGTSDTDELRKRGVTSAQILDALVQEMSKLDRVSGGAQNSIDNMQSAVSQAMISMGSSVATVAVPWLDALSKSLEDTTNAGLFQTATQSVMDSFGLLGDEFDKTTPLVIEMAGAMMTIGGGLRNLRENVKGYVEFLEKTPGWQIINWVRGGKNDGAPDLGQERQQNLDIMNQQMELYEKRKKNREKKAAQAEAEKAMEDMGEKPPPTIPLLERIATNTEPLKQFADQILGGGALARNALNRQDLSDLGSGRRSGDKIENAVRGLVDAVRAEVIGSQLGNPFRQF